MDWFFFFVVVVSVLFSIPTWIKAIRIAMHLDFPLFVFRLTRSFSVRVPPQSIKKMAAKRADYNENKR